MNKARLALLAAALLWCAPASAQSKWVDGFYAPLDAPRGGTGVAAVGSNQVFRAPANGTTAAPSFGVIVGTDLGGVSWDGDAQGHGTAFTVVRIRGVGVSSTLPNHGQGLTFNATTGLWTPTDPASTGVPLTRTITTTAPMMGGGALSSNLTLSVPVFVGDSGSGGVSGLVPAPAAGDAAAGKFLKADGTYASPGGGVTSVHAGTGISVNTTTGSVTVTNTGTLAQALTNGALTGGTAGSHSVTWSSGDAILGAPDATLGATHATLLGVGGGDPTSYYVIEAVGTAGHLGFNFVGGDTLTGTAGGFRIYGGFSDVLGATGRGGGVDMVAGDGNGGGGTLALGAGSTADPTMNGGDVSLIPGTSAGGDTNHQGRVGLFDHRFNLIAYVDGGEVPTSGSRGSFVVNTQMLGTPGGYLTLAGAGFLDGDNDAGYLLLGSKPNGSNLGSFLTSADANATSDGGELMIAAGFGTATYGHQAGYVNVRGGKATTLDKCGEIFLYTGLGGWEGGGAVTGLEVSRYGDIAPILSSVLAQNTTTGFLGVPQVATGAPTGIATDFLARFGGDVPIAFGGDGHLYADPNRNGTWPRLDGAQTLAQTLTNGNIPDDGQAIAIAAGQTFYVNGPNAGLGSGLTGGSFRVSLGAGDGAGQGGAFVLTAGRGINGVGGAIQLSSGHGDLGGGQIQFASADSDGEGNGGQIRFALGYGGGVNGSGGTFDVNLGEKAGGTGKDSTFNIYLSDDHTKAFSVANTGLSTFHSAGLAIPGATSGTATLQTTAVEGTHTLLLPPVAGTLATIDGGQTFSSATWQGTPVAAAYLGAHASSHQNGGSDEVATSTAAANAIPKAGAGGTLAIGWIPTGSTSSTVCIGNDSRLSDSRIPTAHATSHKDGGSDEVATTTPAAGAIPKANGSGKLDSWVTAYTGTASQVTVTGTTISLPTSVSITSDAGVGDITASTFTATSYGLTTTAPSALIGAVARGTQLSPSPVQANDTLVKVAGQGWDTAQFRTCGEFDVAASETWTPTSRGTWVGIQATAIGSANQAPCLVVEQHGATTSSTKSFSWTSTSGLTSFPTRTIDTNLSRITAGVVGAGTGANGAVDGTFSAANLTLYSSTATVVSWTADGNQPSITAATYGSSGNGLKISSSAARGTLAAPTASQQSDNLAVFQASGYGATGFSAANRVKIEFEAAENWTDAAQGTGILFSTTALTTTTRAAALYVASAGIQLRGVTSGQVVGWTTSTGGSPTATTTTGISASAAATVAVGNGSPGDASGTLRAANATLTSGLTLTGATITGAPTYGSSQAITLSTASQPNVTGLGTIGTGTWQATPVTPAYGGTGLSSYAVGDLPYSTASTTLAKLAIGAGGTLLNSTGTAPQWSTIASLVSGSLTGITGLGTVTVGTWNASVIGTTYGGTGVATIGSNALLAAPQNGTTAAYAGRTIDAADLTGVSWGNGSDIQGYGTSNVTVARIQGVNVSATLPNDGQVWTFVASTGKWTPSNPSGSGSVGTLTQVLNNGATTGGHSVTFTDADNLIFGTTTGTQIGTGTTQKLAFYGAAPVVQITGSTDVLAGFVTQGLRAASSNPPLNLGSGAVTCGTVTGNTTLALAGAAGSAAAGNLASITGGAGAGTDKASGGCTVSTGASTGNAAPTSLLFQAAPGVAGGASGSGSNAPATMLTLSACQNALTGGGTYGTLAGTFTDGGQAGSGTFKLLSLAPTLNFTGSPKAQSFTALDITWTNTSAPTGTLNLIGCTVGGTNQFRVSTVGTISGNSFTITSGKFTNYGNAAAAGWGVPAIYGQANITGQSAAATITSYAGTAADGDYEVSATCNVTAATAISTTLTCTYTDVNNVAQTLVLPVQLSGGTGGTYLATGTIAATGDYSTPSHHIRVKASTTITLKTATGTFTSVTYSASGVIRRLS